MSMPVSAPALLDRHLLQYWSHTAYKSVLHGDIDRHLWQVEVPSLACEYGVVMEFVLAISSFHRAYQAHHLGVVVRRDMHALCGSRHQRAGVKLLRHSIVSANRDNARVYFIASLLLVISAWADGLIRNLAQGDESPSSSMLDELIMIYSLTRGAKVVRDTYEVNMRPNGGERVLDVSEAEPPEQGGPLEALLDTLSACPPHLAREENESVRAVCLEAMTLLREVVRKGQTSTWLPARRAGLQWICLVSEDFFRLVQAREPSALVVMSYSCAVMSYGDCDSFVTERWGEVVATEIQGIVGGKWHEAVLVPTATFDGPGRFRSHHENSVSQQSKS